MPANNIGFLGEGNYASRENEVRAEKRALERLGLNEFERIEANEVIKPEPVAEWCYEAKLVWTLANADEAVRYWSSGDWAHLWIACNYLDRAMTDPRKHTPSAQAMDVILGTLKQLRLTDTAKRAGGIIVSREPAVIDPDEAWLEATLRSELENTPGESAT